MPTPFTLHHLRFHAEVQTTIVMDAFKGSALRGAWQSHLRTLYCAQAAAGPGQAGAADSLHQAMCPVCFLLSRETGHGDDRRPYAFQPPLTPQTTFQPGERFSFGISVFGSAIQFLPYLVLAVAQMGQHQGLGRPIHEARDCGDADPRARAIQGTGRLRRGTFRLAGIDEVNPLSGEERVLLAEGGNMVSMPALPVTQSQVAAASQEALEALTVRGGRLALDFLTPTRIVQCEVLVHQPHFAPLFARLLGRIDALRRQFSDEPPLDSDEKHALLSLADQVQLAADGTRWWDVHGRSTRLERSQPLGGYVGRAVYEVPAGTGAAWAPLLPWLLWGSCTQLGKNVVKGCGLYRMEVV